MKGESLAVLLSIVLSMAIGRSEGRVDQASHQGSPTVAPPGLLVSLSLKGASSEVTKVVAVLSRPGHNTLKKTFRVSNNIAVVEFKDLADGVWHLRVTAYDAANAMKYFGEKDVKVLPGGTTPVSLVLNATGSISVAVTWGGQGAGNALRLDGVDDYVEVRNSKALSRVDSAITIEAWVKPEEQYYNTVVSKGTWNYTIEFASGLRPGFILWGLAIDYTGAEDYWGRLLLPESISPGVWTHVAVTYELGSGVKVYINGELTYSTDADGLIDAGDTDLRIGARVDEQYLEPFMGEIDELRIWNIARTGLEIANTMRRELRGNEAGLIGYWKFNERMGSSIVRDSSPNRNHGSVHNHATLVKSGAF